jgi:signal transduction histidine kinase
MGTQKKILKTCLIIFLIGIITILHYSTLKGSAGVHILHRELFFIPILLGGFWFGLNYSICVALAVSILYAPHIFFHAGSGNFPAVGAQVVVFMVVAVIVGVLVDRQRRQHRESLRIENIAVLGRAAATVGYEMRELLTSLRRMTRRDSRTTARLSNDEVERELNRMAALIDTLSSFVPKEDVQLFSINLNKIVRERIQRHQEAAGKANVDLKARLDENGCPSRVDPDKIGSVIDHLIENALDASKDGRTILITTDRNSGHCTVKVRDQGPGIQEKHLSKIFTPFFTTKENGQGLALAVSKKLINEMGGSINVESQPGEGATFTLLVPRD